MPSATLTKTESQQSKKAKTGASSKPILTWLQRKLAGTVRGTRKAPGAGEGRRLRVASLGELRASRNVSIDVGSAPSSPTGDSRYSLSLAPGSIWSPTNPVEADDDASTRPLPPTSPPSPAPSRSSSSYLSDPRTFRSVAASTKPTTVLSIDVGPAGTMMAHIAQAPPTPTTRVGRPSHSPGTSQSVAFSPLAVSPSSSRPPSLAPPRINPPVQAPVHTAHHPRNNPRPSSPPLDNASVLTLASSAYAQVERLPPWQATESDSVSHVFSGADSVSQFPEDITTYEDVDASVRALRPRSERRGSWETTQSDWSAPMLNGSITGSTMAIGVGKPRSGYAPSWKTGPLTDDWTHEETQERDDGSDTDAIKSPDDDVQSPTESSVATHGKNLVEHTQESTPFEPQREAQAAASPEASTPGTASDEPELRTPPFTPTDSPNGIENTPKTVVTQERA
ncbi:hypothetical protein AURDEDRAFT_110594 [Auricularia subglabra TFB-10046 SS5]|nr:hypothetical protein AURDEDRAFT_110594 [Auricularia subglabra TFB-10046 SS5]